MTKLRVVETATEHNQQQVVAKLRDLLERAERGTVRGVIVAFIDSELNSCTSTSAGLSYVEKVGLIEIAKADLVAVAEGRQ